MAEYIEREAAIKLLRGEAVAKYPMSFYMGLFAASDEIAKFPAADVVEVVRCRECKQIRKFSNVFGSEGFKCRLLCVDITPDDFCSYGERKDGASDDR